ncbi:tetratricopeptide repeat protein [Streptomyces sp. NPDC090106]|uniref:tetratricopeptide repeat protein n=1 Tax=Streptomyces sp. NPDC090106 TaxID=3365946 RepID=UPI00381D4CE6
MRGGGGRQGGWWLVVAVAIGVSALSWVSRLLPGVVGGAAVAAGAAVGAVLTQRGQLLVEQTVRQNTDVRSRLLVDDRGKPPRVTDVRDLVEIGVHPAAPAPGSAHSGSGGTRLPPFVRRDRSAEIEQALRMHRFVLVVGESTAGKSRAAFEAVRAVLADATLLVPDHTEPGSVTTAVTASRRLDRCVVWLDDVERYLGTGGLTPRLLRELTGRDGVFVVATIRAHVRARFMDVRTEGMPESGDGALGPGAGRHILTRAHEIRLDRRWTQGELARARERGEQDERVARAVDSAERYGVAEFLAAGPQLFAAWQDAWAPEGEHVRGAALVAAAVEARRAGWHRPLPVTLLRELHEDHLTARGGPVLHPESWDAALRWATTPFFATSGLLLPHPTAVDHHDVFDYLADAIDTASGRTPILDSTWSRLISAADPALCEDLGWAALSRAEPAIAQDAFRRARELGVRTAAVGLAHVLGEALRFDEACRVLRTALESAPPDADGDVLFVLRSSLAWWSGAAGEPGEALALATALHEEAAHRYGEDHPETLETALSRARWTGRSDRPEEALALALAAEERAVRALGATHPTTLSCRFEVAVWTMPGGRPEHAVRLWRELTDDAQLALGPYAGLARDARWNLAHVLRRTGEEEAALDVLAEVIEARRVAYGDDHPMTFAIRLQHAGQTGAAGHHAEALRLVVPLVQDTARALGPDDVLTLAARHQHALWTAHLGQRTEAVAAFRALLADCEAALGPDHELTVDTRARSERPDDGIWVHHAPSW